MQCPLFTYIIVHYNQNKYIFAAIDSVLLQTYSNIELIVIDDCSSVFDKDAIENYISKNKYSNIKDVKVFANKENVGIVRTMNLALKEAKGAYVQLFAADDRIHDENVAEKFVAEFVKQGEKTEILCALALFMDEDLHPPGSYLLNPGAHMQIGNTDANAQYQKLTKGCCFAMGAVCARPELYKRLGYFSERYKYIEDWPFFMNATRSGVKIHTVDFKALDHRTGGISVASREKDGPYATLYQNDVLNMMETEIFPYLDMFPVKFQHELIELYNERYDLLLYVGGNRKKWRWINFCKYSKKVVLWRILAMWRWNNGMLIKKTLHWIYTSGLLLLVFYCIRNGLFAGDSFLIEKNSVFVYVIGAVFFSAICFLIINILVWLIYRVYRVLKER